MSFELLSEDQARRTEELDQPLDAASEAELRAIAESLASMPDDQLGDLAKARHKCEAEAKEAHAE